MKKRKSEINNETSKGKKRFKKKSKKLSEDTEEIEANDFEGELLSAVTIREGMLILGCVVDVKTSVIRMSLPGSLCGFVKIQNISSAFIKALTEFTDDNAVEEPTISSFVHPGMVFPCKVIEISEQTEGKKTSITLSINPEDVNSDLKPRSLYENMVLYVSVTSKEDHGYVVDVGSKCINGFLVDQDVDDKLPVGGVIPTFIKSIIHCDNHLARIQLKKLDCNDIFPEASVCNIKRHSILPGTRIQAVVIKVKHPFIYMKFQNLDVCASILSLQLKKAIEVASTVSGVVLYIHPLTNVIYLTLTSPPTPKSFQKYFDVEKFQSVSHPKYQFIFKNRLYYKVADNTVGFINRRNLPKLSDNESGKKFDSNIDKAAVLKLHYLDKLVQLSVNPSLVTGKIILPGDIKVGDFLEAQVQKHTINGMIVNICPGLIGFIHKFYMCDVFVTQPEKLFPADKKIKCMVTKVDTSRKIFLTCKKSLLASKKPFMLSSYEDVEVDEFYKGVIVKKTDNFIIISFLQDVKGIVNQPFIPSDSVFYEGQTVVCQAISCDPKNEKLKLSLKVDDKYFPGDIVSTVDVELKTKKRKREDGVHCKELSNSKQKKSEVSIQDSGFNENSEVEIEKALNDVKPLTVVIKQVAGHCLNIVFKNLRGRVHITRLGCESEGIFPLRKYVAGKSIDVYIIGKMERKSFNYLGISHRKVKSYLECSLNPPELEPKSFKRGSSHIGFVKQLKPEYAIIHLSPTETGILHYLHFTKVPKVARKIKRFLKMGQSVKVNVLNEVDNGNSTNISLTKIEQHELQEGECILGLVETSCLQSGLKLKLPFGYQGVVKPTDISDTYMPLHDLFKKAQKMKYVQCCVLEVNSSTKQCVLSMRKSRLYSKKQVSKFDFTPEVRINQIKSGDCIKGYVTFISGSCITTHYGTNAEGKVFLHRCESKDCQECKRTQKIIDQNPVGSVIDLVVTDVTSNGKIVLSVSESPQENPRYDRLHINDDLLWSEET